MCTLLPTTRLRNTSVTLLREPARRAPLTPVSDSQPRNSVVVWDRIIRGPKYAKINIARGKQKYEFKEITDSFRCVLGGFASTGDSGELTTLDTSMFRNVSATFSLQYNLQPHVGALQWGEIARTEELKLPPVARRGV